MTTNWFSVQSAPELLVARRITPHAAAVELLRGGTALLATWLDLANLAHRRGKVLKVLPGGQGERTQYFRPASVHLQFPASLASLASGATVCG
jgi:hypothetical protein